MKPKEFLNELEHNEIVAAIRAAEAGTSGEIRIFVSRHKPADVVAAAQEQFTKLEMHKTRERDGVLIFVAPRARKFAVIGDEGVHAKCGPEFWERVAADMSAHFKKSEFTAGILHGIRTAGKLLGEHFPHRPDDENELPDEIAHD